jgi:hypothetical protein
MNRLLLPAHAQTRRQRLAVLRRALPAARDELRMFAAEEEAIGRLELRTVRLRLLRKLRIRLREAPQYEPRPLHMPARYAQPRHLPYFPTIALVTTTRDAGTFLGATVRSVLDQRYPRLQYVIQDAGSTDQTPGILERWRGRLHHVGCDADRGPAQGLNRGFARTDGDILGSLSGDDLLLPGALAFVADFLDRHPDVDVVYGHRLLIDADGFEVGRWVLPAHSDRVLGWACYVPPETLFWRRRLWERVGAAFDEQFQLSHYWDLLLRFRAAGARIVRLPRFLGACRLHLHRRSNSALVHQAADEGQRLRHRSHGRTVTGAEVAWRTAGYQLRAAACHALYEKGWLAC